MSAIAAAGNSSRTLKSTSDLRRDSGPVRVRLGVWERSHAVAGGVGRSSSGAGVVSPAVSKVHAVISPGHLAGPPDWPSRTRSGAARGI
jgi:hypothetical protein